jgi:hypothetical protein
VGSTSPCAIASWLTASYENSALAAYTVYQRAGNSFCPWSVYEESCGPGHNGRYRNYLAQARAAVEQVLAIPSTPEVQGSYYCVDEETVAVSLWWNPIPNASWYEVWHADIERLASVGEPHFEYNVYSPEWRTGAEYTLKVKACNEAGCSESAKYKIVATCGKIPIPAPWPIAAALLALLFGGAGIGLVAFAHKEKLEKLWHTVGKMFFERWWFR